MNEVEQENAVQEVHYKNILEKLVALTAGHDLLNQKLSALEAKPGKRREGIVDKAIWAVCTAAVAFLLGRIGL